MIRIGFDARWYNKSGVGTYVSDLLQCLGSVDDDGFEIIAYEPPDNPVPVNSPKIHKRPITGGKYSPRGQIELAWLCRRDRIDVLHAPFYIVPMLAPCPVVATVHDLIAFLFPIYGTIHIETVKMGYRAACWKSARIITVSDTTANDLNSILHVPREKIVRIYNAYSKTAYNDVPDPGEREHLRQRYGIEGDYVLTLSAENWRTKNLSVALRAMALAESRSPLPFQSVIAGPENGYRATGLSGTIKNAVLTGFVPKEDLPRLYRNASAFLTVSLYEGFGIPLVEAMACGCPCIVSKGGSLPEVAGHAAPSYECDDVGGMADAILRVLAHREYSQQLRESGLRRAAEFSYSIMAKETLHVYRELAK
ncbi:MAG: glycosyltransferase family 1 protein [Terracidiphilus sp.]|jgi:alpha-1,3-rhamnosyl/mannosyltransferase